MIEESVHCFGPGQILTGIYTAARTSRESPRQDTCVVFLNSGLLHRVGPYRMFVDLGREIAAQGLPVLRFDLSGLGESMVRPESSTERSRVVADIREALDFLASQFGHSRFVLIGLCSGADNAHWAALEDSRIAGAVMMDGPGYIDLRYHLAYYLPRLFRLQPWKNAAGKLLSKLAHRDAKQPVQRQEIFVRPFPPRAQMEQEIRQLAERGMKLLFLYTGGVEYYYNHESQFAENFPSLQFNRPGSNIEHEYHREFDHTYSDLRHRRYLFERVQKWIASTFRDAQTGYSAPAEAAPARVSSN